MSEPERHFYHSFPRRQREKPVDELTTGLQVLSSIAASGFLLTPEITEWREPRDDGSLGEPWKVIQKRCCFTELAPGELAEHSEHFGRFSIEFDVKTFRQLGGIPVFYLPRATHEDVGLESLAAALLARTGEIQVLLNRLADLAKLVATTKDKSELLVIRKNEQQLHTRCSLGGAEDVIEMLTHGAQGVDILRNALRALSAFFYPAEDFRYTGLLAYYRQREWRFIANMAKHGQDLDRNLTDQEKAKLMAVDADFFGRSMEFFTGTHRRVDQCRLFSELSGKRLLQYARRIIVPMDAIAEATELLGDSIQVPVVSLEELKCS